MAQIVPLSRGLSRSHGLALSGGIGGGLRAAPFLWDASDDDSFNLTGALVDDWGVGLVPLSAAGGARPTRVAGELNSLPVVRFTSSSSNALSLVNSALIRDNWASPLYSIFSVQKIRAVVNNAGVFCGLRIQAPATGSGGGDFGKPSAFYIVDSNVLLLDPSGALSWKAGFPPEGATNQATSGVLTGGWYVVHYKMSLAFVEIYVNGLLVGQVANGTGVIGDMDSLVIGGRFAGGAVTGAYSDLDMAELRVYPWSVSNGEANAYTAQLGQKWLPASPLVFLP